MKNDTLVILAAAGVGLWLVSRMTQPQARTAPALSLNNGGQVNTAGYVRQIFNTALPGQEGYAWQYYNDGTAIGPDGSYYQNGQKVWSPT